MVTKKLKKNISKNTNNIDRYRKNIKKTKKKNYNVKRYNININDLNNNNLYYYIDTLTDFIKIEGNVSFPVKKYISGKYSANLNAIKIRMNNLKRYKFKLINKPFNFRAKYDLPKEFLKYRDLKTNLIKPATLLFDSENYFKYDLISDYFQELVRLKCKRYNSPVSPYDFWFGNKNNKYDTEYHSKNIEAILKICMNKFAGKVNEYTLNEAVLN